MSPRGSMHYRSMLLSHVLSMLNPSIYPICSVRVETALQACHSDVSGNSATQAGKMSWSCTQSLCIRWRMVPVAMEATAAQVQTMTVLPSFSPNVWSMKPREDISTEIMSPVGNAIQPSFATSWMPVLQQAADNPKHTPAC